MLIDQNISNEPESTFKHNQDCQSCPLHFQEVQKMVNHFALTVSFGEEEDLEEMEKTEKLLDYLQKQYDDESETDDIDEVEAAEDEDAA